MRYTDLAAPLPISEALPGRPRRHIILVNRLSKPQQTSSIKDAAVPAHPDRSKRRASHSRGISQSCNFLKFPVPVSVTKIPECPFFPYPSASYSCNFQKFFPVPVPGAKNSRFPVPVCISYYSPSPAVRPTSPALSQLYQHTHNNPLDSDAESVFMAPKRCFAFYTAPFLPGLSTHAVHHCQQHLRLLHVDQMLTPFPDWPFDEFNV